MPAFKISSLRPEHVAPMMATISQVKEYEWNEERVERCIALSRHHCLVCFYKASGASVPVGSIIYRRKMAFDYEVRLIAVTKPFRGVGVANYLMGAMFAHITSASAASVSYCNPSVMAHVHEENLPALRMFKRLGFKSRIERGRYGDRDAVLFTKEGSMSSTVGVLVAN